MLLENEPTVSHFKTPSLLLDTVLHYFKTVWRVNLVLCHPSKHISFINASAGQTELLQPGVLNKCTFP